MTLFRGRPSFKCANPLRLYPPAHNHLGRDTFVAGQVKERWREGVDALEARTSWAERRFDVGGREVKAAERVSSSW